MTIDEAIKYAELGKTAHGKIGEICRWILETFAELPPCGWPDPEMLERDGQKYLQIFGGNLVVPIEEVMPLITPIIRLVEQNK